MVLQEATEKIETTWQAVTRRNRIRRVVHTISIDQHQQPGRLERYIHSGLSLSDLRRYRLSQRAGADWWAAGNVGLPIGEVSAF